MSPYENRKPRYVREWYLKLKARMKANELKNKVVEDPLAAQEAGLAVSAAGSPAKAAKQDNVELADDNSEKSLNYQEQWDDQLADEISFSDDEEEEDGNGVNLKGAAQYLQPYKPGQKSSSGGVNIKDVEDSYFHAIVMSKGCAPRNDKATEKKKYRKKIISDFDKNWK